MAERRYQCILADPPWGSESGGGRRGAQNHYPLLSVEDIAEVMLASPEWRPAESCHLWLWAPSQIHLAFRLLDLLGQGQQGDLFGGPAVPAKRFRQITFVPWIKLDPTNHTRTRPGLGQYIRHDSELLLLCSTGPAMVPEFAYPQQAILTPKREHSRKPDEQYERIEWISPGPRVEFFARRPRAGWCSWGNEL
ncbi:MAG: MT-A70 family methyltransferase [Deltaproteobacteria bacterium]|nr:MT-A70 family methyltransferase [Deltaproteobacteria bacterium]